SERVAAPAWGAELFGANSLTPQPGARSTTLANTSMAGAVCVCAGSLRRRPRRRPQPLRCHRPPVRLLMRSVRAIRRLGLGIVARVATFTALRALLIQNGRARSRILFSGARGPREPGCGAAPSRLLRVWGCMVRAVGFAQKSDAA